MTVETLYLKPNVLIEPLVDRWYAWPHLISPATAAMNILKRHLRIMQSYVEAPQHHAEAARNPALAGGPFMDYGRNRIAEVRELIEDTRRGRAQMLALARAFLQLDELLRAEAGGSSLLPLYPKVPEALRGYVELVYDLNNQPSFRVLEALLYRSHYHDPTRQSLMLSLIDRDWRPFVMSTPRLPEPGKLHVTMPFASEAVDELFRARKTPRPPGYLGEALGLRGEEDALFSTFLTDRRPPEYQPYRCGGVRWRYFGHACILIETKDVSILLDPVMSYTYPHDLARFTYEDLPERIDYVLITHNHQDHILVETMLQLRHKIGQIVVPRNGGGPLQDPSVRLMLTHCGFRDVVELDNLESLEMPAGSVTALPFLGEHADLDIRAKAAWLVQLGRHKLLFAADSCNVEPRLYDHLHGIVGDVDVLFLGMECDGAPLSWVYGPLLTRKLDNKMDQARRLSGSNYDQGIGIVDRLQCREVYVYAMGQEPWLDHVMKIKYTEASDPIIASNRLLSDCRRRGLVAERLFGMKEILLD
jgi:L-ascorbate metabolism protein UlaG (beta-lactamase superfamily)